MDAITFTISTIINIGGFGIIVLYIFVLNGQYQATYAVGVMFFIAGMNCIIKYIYQQERPFWFDNIEAIYKCEKSFGMVSGHMQSYAGFFGWLLLQILQSQLRKYAKITFAIMFTVVLFAVGFSRVYLGAHFLHQVIYGSIIGILLCLFIMIYNKKIQRGLQEIAQCKIYPFIIISIPFILIQVISFIQYNSITQITGKYQDNIISKCGSDFVPLSYFDFAPTIVFPAALIGLIIANKLVSWNWWEDQSFSNFIFRTLITILFGAICSFSFLIGKSGVESQDYFLRQCLPLLLFQIFGIGFLPKIFAKLKICKEESFEGGYNMMDQENIGDGEIYKDE